MINEENLEKVLSIIAQNFLSASMIVDDARTRRNERSIVLIRHDIDKAIVLGEIALEALNNYRNTLG